ncbi:MAG: hypothetical protein ACRDBM_13510 [Sporomusa sp.]
MYIRENIYQVTLSNSGKSVEKNNVNSAIVCSKKLIETLEQCLSKATGRQLVFDKIFEPTKSGDVPASYAATDLLQQAVGFKPETTIRDGLQRFADWYCAYYQVK